MDTEDNYIAFNPLAYYDFYKNYNDMRKANTIGADKYFHAKANCEAAQHSGVQDALVISGIRELIDGTLKNPLVKHLGLKENITDCVDDIEADLFGLLQGISNTKGNCRDYVIKYRPKSLDNKY